ncbi:hypothetical protein Bca4012_089930 [Brassica carinata]
MWRDNDEDKAERTIETMMERTTETMVERTRYYIKASSKTLILYKVFKMLSAPPANDVVSFKDRATADQAKPHNDLLVIELTIQDIDVARVLVDTGCSANIIYKSTLERMEIDLCAVTENPARYSDSQEMLL